MCSNTSSRGTPPASKAITAQAGHCSQLAINTVILAGYGKKRDSKTNTAYPPIAMHAPVTILT